MPPCTDCGKDFEGDEKCCKDCGAKAAAAPAGGLLAGAIAQGQALAAAGQAALPGAIAQGQALAAAATVKGTALYQQAKEASPAVKSGLEKAEGVVGAAMPVVNQKMTEGIALGQKAKFDIVKYCNEVVASSGGSLKAVADKTRSSGSALYDPIQQKLAASVLAVNSAKTALQQSVDQKVGEADAAKNAAGEEMKTRLNSAVASATELSNSGVAYVNNTKNSLPEGPVKQSVDFILASPALITKLSADVKTKADLDSSKQALENVTNLLNAVKEVMYAAAVPAAAEEPAEKKMKE